MDELELHMEVDYLLERMPGFRLVSIQELSHTMSNFFGLSCG